MTVDPGSVPKGAMPTLDDDYENDTEALDRYTMLQCLYYLKKNSLI